MLYLWSSNITTSRPIIKVCVSGWKQFKENNLHDYQSYLFTLCICCYRFLVKKYLFLDTLFTQSYLQKEISNKVDIVFVIVNIIIIVNSNTLMAGKSCPRDTPSRSPGNNRSSPSKSSCWHTLETAPTIFSFLAISTAFGWQGVCAGAMNSPSTARGVKYGSSVRWRYATGYLLVHVTSARANRFQQLARARLKDVEAQEAVNKGLAGPNDALNRGDFYFWSPVRFYLSVQLHSRAPMRLQCRIQKMDTKFGDSHTLCKWDLSRKGIPLSLFLRKLVLRFELPSHRPKKRRFWED